MPASSHSKPHEESHKHRNDALTNPFECVLADAQMHNRTGIIVAPRQPSETGRLSKASRGDTRRANSNRCPFELAALAIFPECLEFEGQEVLQLVVEGTAWRTFT